MPFNKNKWALFVEPAYQGYKAEAPEFIYFQSAGQTLTTTAEVVYNSIEIPFGARHYFFLNNMAKIFANAGASMNIPIGSKIEYSDDRLMEPEISTAFNFIFGLGYEYKNYSVETRLGSTRDIFSNDEVRKGKYSTFSIILGYKIF